MNYSNQPYRPGSFQVIPSAIKTIIIINIAVFFLQSTLFGETITAMGALWPIGSGNFRIWQPLTYMFLHGGWAHLIFNMFALWMFGAEIENYWGTRQFNTYYFICGIGAAVINLLATIGHSSPTVGASGAIYGVLLAFGMMFPERYIFIYFLVPVKAKYFIAGYALIELLSGLGNREMGSGSNIAHFAHLGGMLIGFLYITIKRNEWSISKLFSKMKVVEKKRSAPYIYQQNKVVQQVSETEINAILDKISEYGYSSLTDEERQKLLKAGENK
ncbi:MAG: rhomboid family intramembrane serine protease [Chlorobiaceae bacterium]